MIIRLLAKFLARPAVADWLIARAMRTPYSHLPSNDDPSYMERYWLLNPFYPEDERERRKAVGLSEYNIFPSIRLHRIMRRDLDRHLHDHPWNARTIILRGFYDEVRLERPYQAVFDFTKEEVEHRRMAGDTATLRFGEYHRITSVSEGGVWTMFISGRKRGTWGFLVGGIKIPWRHYLGLDK